MKFKKNKQKKVKETINNNNDELLLKKLDVIQMMPKSNVKFEEGYTMASTFCATLYVTSFDENELRQLWLLDAFKIVGVHPTIDLMTPNQDEIKKQLKKSERERRSVQALKDHGLDNLNIENDSEVSAIVFDQMSNHGEKMIYGVISFEIHALSLDELNEKVLFVQKELQSMHIITNVQFGIEGDNFQGRVLHKSDFIIPLPAWTIAIGYPFYQEELVDVGARIWGKTLSQGTIALNIFFKNTYRKAHDFLVLGVKGSGKSTLLKFMIVDNYIKNYKTIIFDVENEYTKLIKALGGKVISIDGTGEMINPLQIFEVLTINDDDTVTTANSYQIHLDRFSALMSSLRPNLTSEEKSFNQEMLNELYYSMNLVGENFDYSTKTASDFPTFSSFYTFVEDKYENLSKDILEHENSSLFLTMNQRLFDNYQTLLSILKMFSKNQGGAYANMFDGYTTINLLDEKLISFDLSSLAQTSNNSGGVFQASFMNVLGLIWREMSNHRTLQRQRIKEGKEIEFFLFLIDEAHRFLNSNKESDQAVEFFEKLSRQTRKYYAAMGLATHAVREFNGNGNELSKAMATIFDLLDYKFLMEQKQSAIDDLVNAFPTAVRQHLVETTTFEQGETRLFLGNNETYRFKLEVSEEELALHDGGGVVNNASWYHE